MIDALVVDFDGVIIDTETSDYSTWSDVCRSYGTELDRDLWRNVVGGGFGDFDP